MLKLVLLFFQAAGLPAAQPARPSMPMVTPAIDPRIIVVPPDIDRRIVIVPPRVDPGILIGPDLTFRIASR